MATVQVGRWVIQADEARTRLAHGQLRWSGAVECSCEPCQNYEAYRSELLRGPLGSLLSVLGVDPAWEVEAMHFGRLGPNRHSYSALFHVVGELLSGGPAWRPLDGRGDLKTSDFDELAPGLSVGCHTACVLIRESFVGLPIVQIDIGAELPWVIDCPEPD
jgi:hypothetical protein